MPDSYRQVGDDEVASDWKRKLSISSDKWTATYTRQGMRAALEAAAPQIGDVIETISGVDLPVISVAIDDLDADAAEMTVVSELAQAGEDENDPGSGGEATVEPLGSPTYSIEWQELRRKIETHPNCGTIHAAAGKTWDDWQNFEVGDWVDSTTGWEPWNLALYKLIKSRGTDEYLEYWPIVKRTLYYSARPFGVGSASGKKQIPPAGVFNNADDFEFLCGPDSITKEGKTFRRETQWTGAYLVSSDIYKTAA